MSGGPTYTIDQIINPTEHKATHDGLADGSEDIDANKLELYRSEALNDFVASGGLWSADSFGVNLIASMTSVVAYIGGKRIVSSSVSAHDFTASKYTIIDLGDDGVIDYAEATSIPTVPTLATNHIRLAIIITDATVTTHVYDRRNLEPLSIARVKLTEGTANDLWVDSLPDRNYLKVRAVLIDSGSINVLMRVNSDAGTVYSQRNSVNGAADGTSINQNRLTFSGAAARDRFIEVEIVNLQASQKIFTGHTTDPVSGGTASAPSREETVGKWTDVSDHINLIDILNGGAGSYEILSEMIVYGSK